MRELAHLGSLQSCEPARYLTQILDFLGFSRPIELPLQPVGKDAIDDQRSNVEASSSQELSCARGLFNREALGNGHEHERSTGAIEHTAEQDLQAFVTTLEGSHDRIGRRLQAVSPVHPTIDLE